MGGRDAASQVNGKGGNSRMHNCLPTMPALSSPDASQEATAGLRQGLAPQAFDYIAMIEQFCLREDLSTYDPYDVWKTHTGFAAKRAFIRSRFLGTVPAAVVAAFDTFVNNRVRAGYIRQEYPIVRALAAMCLLNLYESCPKQLYRDKAREHLAWLMNHQSPGHAGAGWGLRFRYTCMATVIYEPTEAFSTVTPYALEAFVRFSHLFDADEFAEIIRSVHAFLEKDLKVMHETDRHLATSYGTSRDRIAFNSVAYTMYAYSMILPWLNPPEREAAIGRIRRLYAYLCDGQRPDGSWFYSPNGRSFIDCFHSCFVLKNVLKTGRSTPLPGSAEVIGRGYEYLLTAFRDGRTGLFKRFSVRNKPGVVKYDLYDNAEMLNLATLVRDRELADALMRQIPRHFVREGQGVYSKIDCLNKLRDLNTLRWAVMPYLYAVSEYLLHA
jgi:hypothetical protein